MNKMHDCQIPFAGSGGLAVSRYLRNATFAVEKVFRGEQTTLKEMVEWEGGEGEASTEGKEQGPEGEDRGSGTNNEDRGLATRIGGAKGEE